MYFKKALLALPVLLALAFAPTHAFAGGPGGSGGGGSSSPSAKGVAAGMWDLPDSGNPGHFVGKMVNSNGVEVFRIVGMIDRDGPMLPSGKMHGKATLLVGPNAGKEFPIRGKWHATDPGKGKFSARIIRKKKGNRIAAEIKGHFEDVPARPGGTFKAHWKS